MFPDLVFTIMNSITCRQAIEIILRQAYSLYCRGDARPESLINKNIL